MQEPINPYLLNVSVVLKTLLSAPEKKIPKYLKNEFKSRFNAFLANYHGEEKIKEVFDKNLPVYLSYKLFPEEYLYWFSLKLSIIAKDGIQTALNFAHHSYQNLELFDKIRIDVLKSLEKNWVWTSKSSIDEVKVWLYLTKPLQGSIFKPEIKELIFLELLPKILAPKAELDLFHLIFSNKTPSHSIGLQYPTYKELSILFSLVQGKKQTNLNSTELAIWMKKNLFILNEEGEEKSVETNTLVNYIESKPIIPEHLKMWFD